MIFISLRGSEEASRKFLIVICPRGRRWQNVEIDSLPLPLVPLGANDRICHHYGLVRPSDGERDTAVVTSLLADAEISQERARAVHLPSRAQG